MRTPILIVAFLAGALGIARADDAPSQMKEAGVHFQRAVALYEEADYRAALVEFRRAYDIAPNATVLYNIGQTQYQLQNYAAALTTLERYLVESGANAAHRDEVKQTLETLRARVGRVALTTNVAGCEITVDDELVGKTPLKDPILVSIGRRKMTVMHSGYQAETRFVEIAAGETAKLEVALVELAGARKAEPWTAPPAARTSSSLPTIAWITTGVLAAGTIVVGVLAYSASRDLADAKATFPTTQSDLDALSSRTFKLSVAADALGAATLIAGGISVYLTLTKSKSHEVRVGMTGGRLVIAGTFR